MPKRDQDYMQARRNEILDAATACLVRTGMAGFSTSALCEEAGISMGALYTHFKTKYEILVALAERQVERRHATFDIKTLKDLRRSLRAVVKTFDTEFGRAAARLDMEVLSMAVGDPHLERVLRPTRRDQSLERALKALQAEGELPAELDAKTSAILIAATLMGLRQLALFGTGSTRPSLAVVDELVDRLALVSPRHPTENRPNGSP